jgi:hypothetical protein
MGEYCKWCASSKHPSNHCPTQNLVRLLTGEPLDKTTKLPEYISVMDAEELFAKSEKDLKNEARNIRKVRVP